MGRSEYSRNQGDINTAAIAIVLVVLYRKILNCPFTVLRDSARVKKLYDKVVQYCFRRFLQAPWTSSDTADEEAVLSDTRAALESALPTASLKSIFSLPVIERRRYIEELSHIVLGIRIFNTQSSRGGVCLPDPRNLIDFRRNELMHALEKKIKEGEKLTRELSEILLKPSDPVSRRGKESGIAVVSLPGLSAPSLVKEKKAGYLLTITATFLGLPGPATGKACSQLLIHTWVNTVVRALLIA